MVLKTLFDALSGAGSAPELHCTADGSRVLAIPHGGRILGLFSSTDDRNFLWTNPALDSTESAKQFYASGEWHNSGGDRTWLSPELDFFFPHYPSLEEYVQPKQLDQGEYQVQNTREELRLCHHLEITLARCGTAVELQIAKSVWAARNPLRHEWSGWRSGSVEYAGYALRTSLKIVRYSPRLPQRISLWNLLQLPHGGDLLLPTYGIAEPVIWFGEVPLEDLEVREHLVRYRMRAKGGQKIGFRATATPGRVGYLWDGESSAALVIRNSFPDPSSEYGDSPWTDPDDLGYFIQACNVDNQFGSFSELEYHAPAAGSASGRLSVDDFSQVWAFRGDREHIWWVAARLLGIAGEGLG